MRNELLDDGRVVSTLPADPRESEWQARYGSRTDVQSFGDLLEHHELLHHTLPAM